MLGKSISWATAMLFAVFLIIALVGGAVVIWGHPGALSFDQYISDLEKLAVALGLLAVGRGVNSGLTNYAMMSAPVQVNLPPGDGVPDEGDGAKLLEAGAEDAKKSHRSHV